MIQSSCNVKPWSSRSCSRGVHGCVALHEDDPKKSTSIEDVLTNEDRRKLDEAHSRKSAFDDDVLDDDPHPNADDEDDE